MNNKGNWICCTGEDCKRCGMDKVDLWESGDKICEECNYNQTEEKYQDGV